MTQQTRATNEELSQLAQDARALMSVTNDVAGENVGEARRRLAAALERGREIYGRVSRKAAESARAAHEAVHELPYQAIAIATGLGALIGYLVAHQRGRNRD